MSDNHSKQEGEGGAGLLDGVFAVARNFLALFINRIELASLELSEVRGNAIKLLVLVLFGAIAAAFALLWLSVLVVALAWQSTGWPILLAVAAFFGIAAAVLFLLARKVVAAGGLSMRTTLEELKTDRDVLLRPSSHE